MRTEAVITQSELEIMQASVEDPNLFTDYFFRPIGAENGWRFDDNFEPEGAWQLKLHKAAQRDITVIGGFATGKTLGVAMSASTWATLTTDFKFLNVAPKAWQAKQMYDLVLLQARGTRFEQLIWEKPRKPYPKIVIRYQIGKAIYESSLEFMSVDRDATGILTWEGDWLHVDEAGLLDDLEQIIINAGSRLRGTVRGRERLGRFSMTSNSWDNFYLWYYFDQAVADPDHFLSIVVSSRHNHNVTPAQLERMIARIPEAERERFIEGTRPEGRGHYFSKNSIYECEDDVYGQIVHDKVSEDVPGYVFTRMHGAGVIHFEVPIKDRHLYMGFGDPGTDGVPKRNSPVLMVWDVTNFPSQPAILVAFWWGNGNGRIAPFIYQMFEFINKYRPVRFYIDSTSTQKNMAYLINEYLFKEKFDIDGVTGYISPFGHVAGIGGLDFSGSGKSMYLQAARLFIENKLLRWPKQIIGIRSQLTNYEQENDKKIPQDIVATLAMSAHAIRAYFHVSPEELLESQSLPISEVDVEDRRLTNTARARRSAVAHAPKYIS